MSKSSDDPWEIFNGYIRIFCGDSGEKPYWGDDEWDKLLKRMWEKIGLYLESLSSSELSLELVLSTLEKTLSSLLNYHFEIKFLPIETNGHNFDESIIPGYHFFRFILDESDKVDIL